MDIKSYSKHNLGLILIPVISAVLLYVLGYSILTKQNSNYRYAIHSYEDELSEYQKTQAWIDELVSLRREFLKLDMYLEESITFSDEFLKILNSSLSSFPDSAIFLNIEIENNKASLEMIVESKNQVSEYCSNLRESLLDCQFEEQQDSLYKVEISLENNDE